MADNQKFKTIKFGKKVKYDEPQAFYALQMKHKRRPWWLLLLLLPLLLLIQCSKDITVSCAEPDTGAPIDDVPVTIEYEAHYLWNAGRFLATDSISRTQNTDSLGQTTFKDLPCSVFSYVFYFLSEASFTAKSGCHAAAGEKHNFHFTRHVDLKMLPRREDLHVKLLDLDTGDPLPDAQLVYKYDELGEEITDSVRADEAGVATIPQMRYCSVMKLLHGSCYGYADTTRVNQPCQELLLATDSTALRLRPIKKRFTFYVKNVENKQPIPGAECQVTLFLPGISGKTLKQTVYTSTDGKGIAAFNDAAILAKIAIHAHKQNFQDSDLVDGPKGKWTVEEFVKQDDDTRTVWLRPLPYLQQFVDVDSLTGRPIPGVHNKIIVTDPDGTVHEYSETSNSNGVFPVLAKEDSQVEIISTKDPEYKKKRTLHKRFKDVKDKKIRMEPEMVELQFRTVKAESPSTPLPNCQLQVSGSISGSLAPNNSGSGVFSVRFRRGEQLTIVASRSGYKRTTDKVTAKTYDYLKVDQERRDIPLKADPLDIDYNKAIKGTTRECYDLKEPNAVFTFSWKTCTACTMVTVTDANGGLIARYGIDSPGGNGVGQQYPPPTGTTTLRCPTQQVCVTVKNVNGCNATYHIHK